MAPVQAGSTSATKQEDGHSEQGSCGLPVRYVVAFWAWLGLIMVYAMRVNLSVAAEDMQSQFNWSSQCKGFVLASFFIGYVLGQMPGGSIATRWGAKWVFGVGVLATAVLTLLIPVTTCGELLCPASNTQSNLVALDLLRVLMGAFESVTYPALYALLAKWTPPVERGRTVSLIFSGAQVGTAIAFPLSGYIASRPATSSLGEFSNWFARWPGVFYFFGLAGVLWTVGWGFFVYSDPRAHPRISAGELRYIESTLQHARVVDGQTVYERVPSKIYLAFFRSPGAIAIFVAHFSNNWSLYLMLTALPNYLKGMLGFNLKAAGALSIAPYLGMVAMSWTGGFLADWMTGRVTSRRVARVTMQLTGNIVPATLFIILGFVTNVPTAVTLVTLAVATSGIAYAGYAVNGLEVCPRYSGILYSVSNTIATFPGIIAPILTGAIVHKHATIQQWRLVFAIAAVLYLVGDVVFAIWCQTDPDPALEYIGGDEAGGSSGLQRNGEEDRWPPPQQQPQPHTLATPLLDPGQSA